jgi:hypothetical protein
VADRKDDPGVLGNLPRSRPGTRSSKRASGGTGPKRQPASRTKATASKSSGASKPRKPARTAATSKTRTAPPPRQQPRAQEPDPVTQAVRLAGKVAEAGVKTAVGILKRLPGGR